MSREQWTAVDRYLEETLVAPDPVLEGALEASAAAGLPAIHVSPLQGRFLQLLALSVGARRILEIGTLGGYSAIWLARALPEDGRMISLEFEPRHAAIALSNIERAGLAGRVEVREGKALVLLAGLVREKLPPFDFVFIDADKSTTPEYFDRAVQLSRPGALIVVDNVIRDGKVADAAAEDASVQGIRRLNSRVAADPRVSATALQTVGCKGYDGVLIARVLPPR